MSERTWEFESPRGHPNLFDTSGPDVTIELAINPAPRRPCRDALAVVGADLSARHRLDESLRGIPRRSSFLTTGRSPVRSERRDRSALCARFVGGTVRTEPSTRFRRRARRMAATPPLAWSA